MRTLFLTFLVALVSTAHALDLIVYPFDSQDPTVGVAIADRVAAGLTGDVIGPGAAPALVVPLVAPTGFVNPIAFLGDGGPFGRNGAWLLRGATGAEAAVTGRVRAEGDALVLDLVLDVRGRDLRGVLTGPRDDPGALAARGADLLAAWLGLDRVAQAPLDLRGADGAHARALGLLGAGLPREALEALEQAASEAPLPPRANAVREGLAATIAAEAGEAALPTAADVEVAAVVAVAALNLGDVDLAREAFTMLADLGVPAAHAWVGALAHNVNDTTGASAAFDAAAAQPRYPFGTAARAAYANAVGALDAVAADLAAATRAADAGTLDAAGALAASLAAGMAGRVSEERELLSALGRSAPYLAYSFERLSFIAFDAGDALAAGQALAVAVELESESDLYWTNYGWALYLLGFLERSEDASRRALAIDASQYIARYNLALAQAVTARLDEALADYREALRYDPTVDAEAIADLVDAETRYPDAVGIPFALGTLLEAAGDRAEAAAAFERYATAADATPEHPDADPARVREALQRATALRAPPPPIAIAGDLEARLGRRGPAVEVARPGDPLVVQFEVVTEGDALPRRLDVEVQVQDGAGTAVLEIVREVDVPMNAIGYVIDVSRVQLPDDLAPGRYAVRVSAAGDGLDAEAVRSIEVEGEPQLLRGLIGRDVTMLALDTNQPLYGVRDLPRGDAALESLVRELRATADAAEEVLPFPEEGRFAGLSGGEIFGSSQLADVLDFVRYLLAVGAEDTSFTFVDGYAEWAVDGAPGP
jgi:tetratricopeptide (TPR) repeat protein